MCAACIVCNHSQAEQLSQGKCFLFIIAKVKNPVSFYVDAAGACLCSHAPYWQIFFYLAFFMFFKAGVL